MGTVRHTLHQTARHELPRDSSSLSSELSLGANNIATVFQFVFETQSRESYSYDCSYMLLLLLQVSPFQL
jgi:hypothetical protein